MRREGNKEEAEVTAEKEAIKRGREWKQGSSESLPLLTFIAEFVLRLPAPQKRVCVLISFFIFCRWSDSPWRFQTAARITAEYICMCNE